MHKWNERGKIKKFFWIFFTCKFISKKNILFYLFFDLGACFLTVPDCQNYILTSLIVYIFINSKS